MPNLNRNIFLEFSHCLFHYATNGKKLLPCIKFQNESSEKLTFRRYSNVLIISTREMIEHSKHITNQGNDRVF